MLAALVLCYFVSNGQNTDSFRLSGTINTDSGTIRLAPDFAKGLYDKNFNFTAVPIVHGKFTIKGKIADPSMVLLILDTGGFHVYISGRFFIDTGEQSIVCEMQAMRDIPAIDNVTMKEYMTVYRSAAFQAIDTISDYNLHNSLAIKYWYQYAKNHPDSWVALWMISHKLSIGGYNPLLDSAFNLLSDNMQHSHTGISVKNDLDHMSLTGLEKKFPKIEVYTLNGKSVALNYLDESPQYILVDFWFSHCGPCISQFPDYKKIVNQYQHKRFVMLGISSDSSAADIVLWKHTIQSKALNWNQYRVAPKTLDFLRIYYAPKSYLLDGQGRIVATDLDTKELADFLKTHLKQEVSSETNPATRIQSKLE